MTAPRLRRASWAAAGLVLVCGAVLAPPAAGEYRTVTVESLRVTIDSDWATSSAAPGYLPVRFDIMNLGDERVIDIVGQGQRVYRGGRGYVAGSLSVRQRLRLARAARVRFTMDVPTGGNTHVQLQIREGGQLLEAFGYTGTQPFVDPAALIVVTSGSPHAELAQGWLRPATVGPVPMMAIAGRPASPRTGPPLDVVLEPDRLPTSWLGYTSLQAVVVGPREWELLDAAQRAALLAWIGAGGSLILVDGGLETLFPDPQHRPVVTPDGIAAYLFGHVHLQESGAIQTAGFARTLESVTQAIPDRAWTLPLTPAAAASGRTGWARLPIPGVESVPSRAYLAILVLFSVLLGPVNHVVLRRLGQPALIVLTTPLLALVFLVVLAGYVVVVEGFAVKGRAVTYTMLDQAMNQAATRATVSLYAAGRAPSGGLRFPRDLAVISPDPDGASGADRHLDLTESQRFSAGLLDARVPSSFETIGVRPARERLNIRRDGGQLRVTNGLGATVTRLFYRGGGGSYTLSDPLPAGATSVLQSASMSGRDLLPPGDAAFAVFDHAVANQPQNSYLAVLDRSPFLESGVNSVEERGSFHLVLGTGAGEP